MSNFYEFMKASDNKKQLSDGMSDKTSSLRPALAVATVAALNSFALAKTQNDIATFSENLSSVLSSDKFIQELSDSIGQPLPDESEDAFVTRSKESLSALLHTKL